jgi:CMP-N-acetylneuraminic acid synthetase
MSLLITICARGGSKGIPGKNIRDLNGMPLIAYSIKVAQKFLQAQAGVLSLSTDSDAIKAVAAQYGLTTEYTRPQSLSGDKVGKIDAIKDILLFEENSLKQRFEFILDLDVTSPLRTVEDLETAFLQLKANDQANNIFSVNPANRNPYFNMVEDKGNGYVGLVKQDGTIKSRQEAPQVYDMNASFYFYRRSFFDEGFETAVTDRSLCYVMPHTCFDLDEPMDFTIMEILIREKLLDFNFS